MVRSLVARAVVADTSALAFLLDENLEHLLPRAFREILLPRHVECELRRRGPRRKGKLKRLLDDGIVVRCTDYSEAVVLLWHSALGRFQENRDKGEAEALAQCQSRNVHALLTTDRKATRLAQSQEWEVVTPTDIVAKVGDD
jgi:predicted nucleic acid-binding protein